MLLEVQERLALLELIPKEADYAAIKTLRRAREMLSFSPDEQKTLEFENKEGGLLIWNVKKAAELVRDIPVDEWTTNKFRDILINLSNDNKLADMHFTLYEKFVVNFE
jgi:hypothetical protein